MASNAISFWLQSQWWKIIASPWTWEEEQRPIAIMAPCREPPHKTTALMIHAENELYYLAAAVTLTIFCVSHYVSQLIWYTHSTWWPLFIRGNSLMCGSYFAKDGNNLKSILKSIREPGQIIPVSGVWNRRRAIPQRWGAACVSSAYWQAIALAAGFLPHFLLVISSMGRLEGFLAEWFGIIS